MAPYAGRRITASPAEPRGALAQAGHQVAAGERLAGLGMHGGLIQYPQVHRVDAAGLGQLVHGRFQSEHPRALTRRSHPGRSGHVKPDHTVGGAPVRRGVHVPGGHRRLLGELLERGGLIEDVMAQRHEPAVRAGAQPHPLDRRRPVAGHREHLRPGNRTLDRPPDHPRGHRREDHVGPRHALGPEPAADVLGDHPHAAGSSPNTAAIWPAARDGPWVASYKVSVSPCHAAMLACGSIGWLCSAGVR